MQVLCNMRADALENTQTLISNKIQESVAWKKNIGPSLGFNWNAASDGEGKGKGKSNLL